MSSGIETLIKNLRVLAEEADAIRARAACFGIELQLFADQIETANLKRQATEAEGGTE